MPRLALDQNGDPLIAYFWYNPSGNDNPVDSAIYFTGWNRSQGQFSKPVSVAVTGDISGSSGLDPTIPFALSHDASNNTLAIAYHAYSADRTTEYIDIAFSTNGGQSWTNKVVTSDTEHFFSSVDVELANGNVYLTYYHDNDGIRYLTGSETANPNTWKSSLVPTVSGYTNYYQVVGLAADSNGVPGIVYILGSATSNNLLIEYWRPTQSATPNQVMTTNGFGTDGPDVKLGYAGTAPRVVFVGQRDNNYFADYDHTVWAAESADGKTWTVANVPADNGTSMTPPAAIAGGSQGQTAITANDNGGNGTHVCGEPKLILTSDFQSFNSCSPGGQNSTASFDASYAVPRYGNNDQLFVSFQQPDVGVDLPYGVIVWVQPQGGATPQINNGGIVIHGGVSPNVSPGSLVDIYGVNLASSPTSADSSAPSLPTTLDNVQVTVNGAPAPLIYVGPSQIIMQVPYATAAGAAQVVVTSNGVASPAAAMTVQPAAPSILTYNGNRAVVQNQDYSINESNNGSKPGDVAIVYLIGSGPVNPAVPTGAFAPNSPLSNETLNTKVTVGGVNAPVIFSGMAPGFAGLVQINFQIPSMNAGDYPIQVTIGSAQSNQPIMTVTR